MLLSTCAPAFEPPAPEAWTGEPQVAEKLRAARQRAIEEPESAAAIGRLGMVFHAHELHAEAILCYRRASVLAPGEPRWPYLAAVAAAKTDLEASVAEYERAVAAGIDHAAAYIGFADALTRLGRTEEAAAQYRRALQLDPDSSHALYGLAQAAFADGDSETAAVHLEKAVSAAPSHGEVHTLLAQVYRRLGGSAEAEVALLRARAFPEPRRAPDPMLAEVQAEAVNSRAFTQRGQRLARAGHFAEAEKAFRRVLEIRPGNARDYSNLGGALTGQGRLDEAVAACRRALEIDPDDTYALNNLALALAGQGDLEGAAELFQRAFAIDPAYTDPLRNLGLLRARQRRHGEAVELYRRALEVNPSLVQVLNDLGASLAARGELAEAMRQWQRVLEIDRRELAALYNLSTAHAMRGEHRQAVRRLRQGLELAPDSSRLVSLLAWELATAPDAELRDGAEAERLARRVHAARPDQPQPADVLAAALAAQGRYEEAVPLAEQAVKAARRLGQGELAAQIGRRLERYRRRQAFVQAPARAAAPAI